MFIMELQDLMETALNMTYNGTYNVRVHHALVSQFYPANDILITNFHMSNQALNN